MCSARLTDELVKAYDLQKEVTVCARGTAALPLLPPQGACRFHTDSYVRFLQQISHNGIDIVDEAAHYALNSSVCFSETAWEYSQIYAGASVEGAGSVARGEADVAINWMGGQTHARRDCASRFPPLEASGKTLASQLVQALPARNSSLELARSQKSKTNSLNS